MVAKDEALLAGESDGTDSLAEINQTHFLNIICLKDNDFNAHLAIGGP